MTWAPKNDQSAEAHLLSVEADKIDVVCLEKRRLWGDLVVSFQYLKEAARELESPSSKAIH